MIKNKVVIFVLVFVLVKSVLFLSPPVISPLKTIKPKREFKIVFPKKNDFYTKYMFS